MKQVLHKATLGVALLALVAAGSGIARADDAPPPDRPVPNYDGREEPTTAADVMVWIPRVMFYPVYVVTEYGVRTPLSWLFRTAEENHWPTKVVDFLTVGPGERVMLVPSAFVDFGFRPSVGLYVLAERVGREGHSMRFHAATGGKEWFTVAADDRLEIGRETAFEARAEFTTRPDFLFHGIGPRTPGEENESRYGKTLWTVGLGLEHTLGLRSTVRTDAAVLGVDFDADDRCCGEPSLATAAEEGRFPVPPAADTGFLVYEHGLVLDVDTRPPRPQPGGGVHFNLDTAVGADIRSGDGDHGYVRYGGTLGGWVDVTGHYRLVGLSVTARFADPLGGEVPFTRLIDPSEVGPLPGFRPGRLRDRSMLAARLEYRWPIWMFLDGTLHAAVGNVFGEHLDGFDLGATRMSIGMGMKSALRRDHPFDLILAFGTEPLDQGFAVDSVRFVVGTSRAF
ncbi:MAG: hypothetical protein ACQEXJ_01595 [Myxococcota bacterium]